MKLSKCATVFLILFLSFGKVCAQSYTLITYNVENLFDADGVAVFNDYKPYDINGQPQYTKKDVLTKIHHITKVLKKYDSGRGPDIILFEELEGDFTPKGQRHHVDVKSFLKKYSGTTLSHMLGSGFNKTIRNLPSELLLLKGMADAGLTGYDYRVGYSRLTKNGRPRHVQKCGVFTRFPIEKGKTRIHPIKNARPILEVWLTIKGHNLIVFANHWKAGASSYRLEQTRIADARVLRKRLNILLHQNPNIDFIVGGDFNSSYNQLTVLPKLNKSAINTVLKSTGNEELVDHDHTRKIYNLWYELPLNKRGSEVYHGYWSTLIEIMLSPGMYDYNGIQYVDNSFKVGSYKGLNVEPFSNAPERWTSIGSGKGFSDHFPVSMKFRVVSDNNPQKKLELKNPGHNDDNIWKPIPVKYPVPQKSEVFTLQKLGNANIRKVKYYDELFYLEKPVSINKKVVVNGKKYQLYSGNREVIQLIRRFAGKSEKMHFYGRLSKYRNKWEFVIDTPKYIVNQNN